MTSIRSYFLAGSIPFSFSACVVKIWRVETGVLQQTLENNTNGITCIIFSPDGEWLSTAGFDNTIRLWFQFDKENMVSLSAPTTSTVNDIAFYRSSQGTFLASRHDDCSVRYWKVIQKDNLNYLQLLWSTYQNTLLAHNACIEGAKGLSKDNLNLLLQRGAARLLNQRIKSKESHEFEASSSSLRQIDISGAAFLPTSSNMKLFSEDAKIANGNKEPNQLGLSKELVTETTPLLLPSDSLQNKKVSKSSTRRESGQIQDSDFERQGSKKCCFIL